jgi:hypothetical protein
MDGTVDEWDKDIEPIQGVENDLRVVKLKAINCRTDLYAYAEFTLVNPGSLSEKFWKDGKKAQAHTMAWTNIVEPGTEWEQEFYIEGVKASETVEDVIWLGSITEGLPDTKASTVYQLDVDVDSDNNGSVEDDVDDKLEESKDTDKPGKVVISSVYLDSDADGTPDFADGLGLEAKTTDMGTENSGPCGELAFLNRFMVELQEPIDIEKAEVIFDYPQSIPRLTTD